MLLLLLLLKLLLLKIVCRVEGAGSTGGLEDHVPISCACAACDTLPGLVFLFN